MTLDKNFLYSIFIVLLSIAIGFFIGFLFGLKIG